MNRLSKKERKEKIMKYLEDYIKVLMNEPHEFDFNIHREEERVTKSHLIQDVFNIYLEGNYIVEVDGYKIESPQSAYFFILQVALHALALETVGLEFEVFDITNSYGVYSNMYYEVTEHLPSNDIISHVISLIREVQKDLFIYPEKARAILDKLAYKLPLIEVEFIGILAQPVNQGKVGVFFYEFPNEVLLGGG